MRTVTIGRRQIATDDARRITDGLRQSVAVHGEPLAYNSPALEVAEVIERAINDHDEPVAQIGGELAELESLQQVLIAITKSSDGANPELRGLLSDVNSALLALY